MKRFNYNFTQSIIGKLWVAITGLVVVTLLLLGISLSHLFENYYFKLQADKMIRDGINLSNLISRPNQEALTNLDVISNFIESDILVLNRDGLVSACPDKLKMFLGEQMAECDIENVLKGETVVYRGSNSSFNIPVLMTAVPVAGPDGEVLGAVVMYSPQAAIQDNISQVRRLMLYAGIGAIILGTVLAFLLSKTISNPLLHMNDVALKMSKGNFDEKIGFLGRKDEVGTLGRTLDNLSDVLCRNLSELSQERDQLENILSSMTDGVATFNKDKHILMKNEQADRILAPVIAGEKPLPDYMKLLYKMVDEVLEKNTGVTGDLKPKKEDKNVISVRISPLRLENGNVWGAVALFQDVTKERRLEDLRREFVANVSHELRTPLSYLQGYTEALLDGMARNWEQTEQYLKIILEETLRLRRLVNDLLDLANLEAGQIKMEKQLFSMTELINRVAKKMNPLAKDKQIEVKVKPMSEIPLVYGDEDRIEQVVINLINNAINYTPPKGEVAVGFVKQSEGVRVFVTDTGCGISEEELPFVWERFYKVDKARTRGPKRGTGLGLAIVKNIITAHGGKVGVKSEINKGTEFYFILPEKKRGG